MEIHACFNEMNLMVRNTVFIFNIVSFQDCLDGYFGSECLNKCGHCLNVGNCNHINGSCLKGCSKGYKGDYCKECKLKKKPMSFFTFCIILLMQLGFN